MARKADPNRKNMILSAAGKVFSQKGYASTRMIEVAEVAQVGKGTIYEYFSSKEDLFFAVFEKMMTASGDTIKTTIASLEGPLTTRMKKLTTIIIQSWMEQIDMYSLVMEFWAATASSPSRQRFKDTFQEGYRYLRSVLSDLIHDARQAGEIQANVNPGDIAAALVGTLDALLLQHWLDPEIDPLAISQSFIDTVMAGLRLQTNDDEPS